MPVANPNKKKAHSKEHGAKTQMVREKKNPCFWVKEGLLDSVEPSFITLPAGCSVGTVGLRAGTGKGELFMFSRRKK